MNEEYIETCSSLPSDDSSLTIDSSYLTLKLIQSSTPYTGKVLKKPETYSFPKYLPCILLEDSNLFISDEEVYYLLYVKKIVKGKEKYIEKEKNKEKKKEKEKDEFFYNRDKENHVNILSNTSDHSLYLKNTPVSFKSTTDPKFTININEMDDRTTCMIKNIPNKYTQKMLINLLNEHHYGCFDFVYLRMDFKNKCNVGYVFVNFTKTEHIITFYKKINNKGWKLFSSNKIAELTYASIQGLDNLMNKFRNSLVMKEQESYRPKIFYKEGGLKGQEKPMF